MSFIRNISVRVKIVLIITIISAVSVLLSLTVNLITGVVEAKKEYRSDALNYARLLGDYCIMPIEFNYPERAEEVLQTTLEKDRVHCSAVYNTDGVLFASACEDKTLLPESVNAKQPFAEFDKNDLFIIEPIEHNGNIYGAVYVRYYTRLRTDLISQISIAILVLFTILFLSFFLALHFQRYISQPILKLAALAGKLSETQNYSIEIKKTSNDEIGVLYDSFNQMLKAINVREKERDEAASALIQSEEKFRNIFNFSLDGIIVTNMDGDLLEASNMAMQIFDVPYEALLGKNIIEIMPEGYHKQRPNIIKNLLDKGNFTFVTRFKNSNDTIIHLEFSSKIINHNGEKSILSLIRDITKRVKSDEALRESEERYKKLVESFPSAIALHREGKIVFVNNAIKETLGGRTKLDFINKDILDLVPKDSANTAFEQFRMTMDENISMGTIEIKMKRLDGEIIDVEMSSIPLFFDRKKTVLSVFKDISSRKKIEGDLVVALKQAEESDKLKSSFLANMSHEIRTPMNGIIGFADLLKKDDLTQNDLDRYVDIIKTSADRLLTIINDIIDISKIEAGAINVSKEKFDLVKMSRDIFEFYKPLVEAKGITLKLVVSDDTIVLNSDKSKISQILTNLVSNALKFTRNGVIEIGCLLNGEENTAELYVKDTGIGIPMEQLNSIFERFRQADHYMQDFNEGTGLGLSICKGFSDALGGHIWVESELEKGSNFHFEIPAENYEKSELEMPGSKPLKAEPKLRNINILIVEDEENNYLYLKELLEPQGANILWADDGLKAVQFVLEHPEIDFVLMDIKLPIMDGLTAAKKIKVYRNNLPIVAQTAFGLESDRERTMAAGLDDYLAKPILKDELFNVINKLVYF
jgi:PAS domain S-box-containing protein